MNRQKYKEEKLYAATFIKIASIVFGMIFVMLKSFFLAVTQVAWGIASLFFLSITMFYLRDKYGTDITYVSPVFASLITFVMNNIMLWVFVFCVLHCVIEYKEVNK